MDEGETVYPLTLHDAGFLRHNPDMVFFGDSVPQWEHELVQSLLQLQKHGLYCDLRLEGCDGHVMAHSCVMAAVSPVLAFVFKMVPRESWNHSFALDKFSKSAIELQLLSSFTQEKS